MTLKPEAFYLPSTSAMGGQRFCLFYPAQGSIVRGHVLYIHPFTEEMNKSRRMAALQSRALAMAGYSVLQIDLLGCGDSSGDFGDANWDAWASDVVQGCQWLDQRNDSAGVVPLWLWGLRAGCLVAVAAASRMDVACHFLFWQPPTSGKPLLQQFLRLKLAGDLMSGQSKGVMDDIRQKLAEGDSVEIAGYTIGSKLAKGLENATLAPPAQRDRAGQQRLEWIELSTRDDAALSPVSSQMVTQWQQATYNVRSQIVRGPAFWQTSEIEEVPTLITATIDAIESLSA
jgi:exosortase A-associated hydrolase 2